MAFRAVMVCCVSWKSCLLTPQKRRSVKTLLSIERYALKSEMADSRLSACSPGLIKNSFRGELYPPFFARISSDQFGSQPPPRLLDDERTGWWTVMVIGRHYKYINILATTYDPAINTCKTVRDTQKWVAP